jgi:peptidoglycan/xylan/chitin deacetylase (PgdA/CDA1 family)
MKPLASLSLDLDNEWSYLKTHGEASWVDLPSYLDVVVPRVLEVLADHGLTITFFVVGQDAALPRNHDALRSIADAGHEVGNHSFRHEPWLHKYPDAEVRDELQRAEEAIEKATGFQPVGFRGPGYSLSPAVLNTLVERGYRYDCSTLPTIIGPLARMVYFRSTKLDPEQRAERADLFGHASEALRPLKPYRWAIGPGLVEIPVTVLPGARVPMHVSYLLALSGRSRRLARSYFRAALELCKMARVEPSLLLHPLDFIGGDDVDSLAFFPGMAMQGREKTETTAEFLDMYAEHFEVATVGGHAAAVAARPSLPVVDPNDRRPRRPAAR